MGQKNKIGILTWHYYGNFGSALQAYALQTSIKRLGYEVEIINYHNKKFGNIKGLKTYIKKFLSFFSSSKLDFYIFRKIGVNTVSFQRKYLKQTQPFSEIDELPKYIENVKTIVYGSDQIWAPNVFNPIYMGEGVPDAVKKISYAASIGLRALPEEYKTKYARLLKSYSDISVRENEGRNLLKSIGVDDVQVVLDPTLLLNVSYYKEIEKKVYLESNNYIFCYFLNEHHQYWETVRKYAEEHKCIIVGVSDNPSDATRMFAYKGLGADHFLWLIDHSYTVFTDSYHGSIFSLLFHKNFYLFRRFSENDPVSQNSRVEQLVETFSIKERLIDGNIELPQQPIDYAKVEKILMDQRAQSLEFLRNALIDHVRI